MGAFQWLVPRFIVEVIASQLDDPAGAGGASGRVLCFRRASLRRGGVGCRRIWIGGGLLAIRACRSTCLLRRCILGDMGFRPLRLETAKPLRKIGEILAVHAIDVEFLSIGRILRRGTFIAWQQRLHRPHHVERLEPLVLDLRQPLLLGDGGCLPFANLTDCRRGSRRLLFDVVGLAERGCIQVGGIGRPGGKHSDKIDDRRSEKPDQRTHGPRLLGFDDALENDLIRQQVRADARHVRRLQGKAIGGSIRELVLPKGRVREHRCPFQSVELVEPLHIELQLLSDEVCQPTELGRISE